MFPVKVAGVHFGYLGVRSRCKRKTLLVSESVSSDGQECLSMEILSGIKR